MKLEQIKKIRDDWVAALRSGEYTQGRKTLYRGPVDSEHEVPATYCCLGVLAAQSGVSETELADLHYLDDLNIPGVAALETAADALGQLIPLDALKPDGTIMTVNWDHKLFAELNDSQGKTFADIADILEKMDLSTTPPEN